MYAHGYGQILDIDLSTGRINKTDVDPQIAQKYIGGGGLSHRILFDEVGSETDPYSPENILIYANGPLTGTRAPCGGRTEVTTLHPLTGSIGTGNTGGIWGAVLKRAGFDVLIVRNKADMPVYLWIDDGNIDIRDAGHLWGKDARVTTDILREELSGGVSVMAIGQAGENLVRYALALNDYYHVAGRCGAGGVMGSKNLKAIAIRGTGTPEAVRPKEFLAAVHESRERLKIADRAFSLPSPVSGDEFHRRGERPGMGREDMLKFSVGKGAICYSCRMNCYNDMGEVKEGKYAGLKESNVTRPMVVGLFGGLGIDNLPAVWKCKDLSQRFGMDYASVTRIISFAMELYKDGLISNKDTEGMELVRGNEDGIMEMMQKIALRDGFGDILADGSAVAAQKIGNGAEQYVKTIKGMEGGSVSGNDKMVTGANWWFLGMLTNPRGDITTSTHFTAAQYNPYWSIDEYDMFPEVKQQMYSMPMQTVSSTWEGKAMMLKWFEDLHSTVGSLGLCFFPSHMRLALGPNYLSQLYSTYTGLDISPEELMKSGERIFNLTKAYIVRKGLARKDDRFPLRVYEGTTEIPQKRIDTWLDEYYELRNWDKASGLPTREKLEELDLHDVANELHKLSRIP